MKSTNFRYYHERDGRKVSLGETFKRQFHGVIRSLDDQGLETLLEMIRGEQRLREVAREEEP